MSTPIPKTMRALLVQEGKKVAVKEHPVPSVRDDDILVKTVAVAQNPTDWKYVDRIQNAGTILGCDFSGYVAQVGKNVTSPKVGDHVAGFTQGGTYTDGGAYAEYIRTPADLVWVVPPGILSHEEAATLGCGFWTAIQALYHPKRLGLVEPPAKVGKEEWILIYGGSTSVGQYAIQLAHLSGYKIVTTASPRNFELVSSLGADTVFDYRDPDLLAKIKEATGDSIRAAFDTYATKETQTLSVRAIAPGGGKFVTLLMPEVDANLRTDVQIIHTLLYTCLGRYFKYGTKEFHPSSEDKSQIVEFLKKVPALVAEGKIKPNKIKLWEGGLEAISDGLQYMREGKISAEKIVYRV